MATAPVGSPAVVDGLTVVPVLRPSAQTLAHVGAHACLYALGLQGAHTHTHTHAAVTPPGRAGVPSHLRSDYSRRGEAVRRGRPPRS